MKKIEVLAVIAALVMSTLLLPACGKSEFGMAENTGKKMVINAENAAKDSYFVVGTLDVEEGEQVVITSGLSKGTVKVEILAGLEGGDVNEVPEASDEAILTADIGPDEGASGTMPAGSYMLRATCVEKATGTVTIDVTEASAN